MKIVIAGYGAEGRSNYRYFRAAFPEAEIVIADENENIDAPYGVPVLSGAGVFSRLQDADMVVRTAGLSPHAITTNGTIWSATNEFFAKCPAPIIGITGTKGKGTTASLVASILRAAGRTVHLVGNIGVPALDVLTNIAADDVVVYELSSFQLWDLERSPNIAVVLMIEPDHLDVHASLEEYLEAKSHIATHLSSDGICLYHPTNKMTQRVVDLAHPKNKARYRITDDNQAYEKKGAFYWGDERLCDIQELRLPGRHNIDNACAALSAVKAFDSAISGDTCAAGLRAFTGLEHRLKYVATRAGVAYFDDSIATTPGSAIAALRSFDAPKVLILGGHDKGADYAELAQEIHRQNMRAVILIGQTAPAIHAVLQHYAPEVKAEIIDPATMQEIVRRAANEATSGDVVILSPAAASFGLFKNYKDRGEQFAMAVKELEG